MAFASTLDRGDAEVVVGIFPLLSVTVTQSVTLSNSDGARLTKMFSEIGLFRG